GIYRLCAEQRRRPRPIKGGEAHGSQPVGAGTPTHGWQPVGLRPGCVKETRMKSRIGRKLAGSAALLGGGVARGWVGGARGPAGGRGLAPRQGGGEIRTRGPADAASCKVDLVKGQGKASGWLLSDANGQPLRRFFDSNGDVKIDVWSYYKDGVE